MTATEFYDLIGGNYNDALNRLMNDTLIKKFVLKFTSDPSFEGLKSAVNAEDWDNAFSYSHTLKGVALNLAFARLSEAAVTLTDTLRPQNRDVLDTANVKKLFGEVEKEYLAVLGAIEKFAAQ